MVAAAVPPPLRERALGESASGAAASIASSMRARARLTLTMSPVASSINTCAGRERAR